MKPAGIVTVLVGVLFAVGVVTAFVSQPGISRQAATRRGTRLHANEANSPKFRRRRATKTKSFRASAASGRKRGKAWRPRLSATKGKIRSTFKLDSDDEAFLRSRGVIAGGESPRHRRAKDFLADVLRKRWHVQIKRACLLCGDAMSVAEVCLENDDVVATEWRSRSEKGLMNYKGSYRPDVAVVRGGTPAYIFEVYHTSPTRKKKASVRPEPWYEIHADMLINEERTHSGSLGAATHDDSTPSLVLECIRERTRSNRIPRVCHLCAGSKASASKRQRRTSRVTLQPFREGVRRSSMVKTLAELQSTPWFGSDTVVVCLDYVREALDYWMGYAHDETRSIFIRGPSLSKGLRAGNIVRVTGFRVTDRLRRHLQLGIYSDVQILEGLEPLSSPPFHHVSTLRDIRGATGMKAEVVIVVVVNHLPAAKMVEVEVADQTTHGKLRLWNYKHAVARGDILQVQNVSWYQQEEVFCGMREMPMEPNKVDAGELQPCVHDAVRDLQWWWDEKGVAMYPSADEELA